ncbi:MAG TPA: stage IV sporulation protein A [Clostridiales bacterium]|nr:stage IV sporulation protein A [Clostridiales bacterium]
MADQTIYQDIAKRTGGDIYIGVVGPVRTGKSTFIHRFLDSVVLPNIENEYDRTRTLDEMPQSASGKTVMTTEPKFVPDESVRIRVGEDTELNVKMIDCVGYMVDGALGGEEDGAMRMVKTPWSEEEMPFSRAAEIGTGKVIGEHSTIGMLVTTDGSICDIPRENYVPAEERVAAELQALGKPFAIILNSATPEAESAHTLASELEEKYDVPVALVSCASLDKEDIRGILSLVLGEFPVRSLTFTLPSWTGILKADHPLRRALLEKIDTFTDEVHKLGDIEKALDHADGIVRVSVNAGDGTGDFELPLESDVYYQTMSELCGLDITDDRSLIATVCDLAKIKKEYEKVESALKDVNEKGYGIVMPDPEELELEEPRLVKSAGGWGVKVAARADSIHMIRAGIKAELNPVVGTEEQSEEVAKHLMTEFEEDPKKVWDSNIFGKSLYDLVNEGMKAKLLHIPDDSREKLGETLEKILNEGSNGLICILL